MNVTLRELYEGRDALARLLSAALPARTAFYVARSVRLINQELVTLEEQRNVLIQRFGQPEDSPGKWLIPAEQKEAFWREFNDLLDERVELSIDPLLFDALPSDFALTPADAMALEFLFSG